MFRGYTGKYCVGVDDATNGFRWSVTNPDIDAIIESGEAATMQGAIKDAYDALAKALRTERLNS
jgi:hypothetical protein